MHCSLGLYSEIDVSSWLVFSFQKIIKSILLDTFENVRNMHVKMKSPLMLSPSLLIPVGNWVPESFSFVCFIHASLHLVAHECVHAV